MHVLSYLLPPDWTLNRWCWCVAAAVLLQTLYPSFKIKDPEEKVKARQELLAGALADKLKLLSKVIVSAQQHSWQQGSCGLKTVHDKHVEFCAVRSLPC